jgi:hypothetical protein
MFKKIFKKKPSIGFFYFDQPQVEEVVVLENEAEQAVT